MPPTPSPFEYHEAPPPADVASVVHSFWMFRATNDAPERYQHTVWPDACVSLGVVDAPPAPPMFITVPARTEAFEVPVRRNSRVCGVRFWPDTGQRALAELAPGDAVAALVRAVTTAIPTAASSASRIDNTPAARYARRVMRARGSSRCELATSARSISTAPSSTAIAAA